MTSWKDKLRGDPLPWLLEPDQEQPAVRYFTLRDILGRSEHDGDVREALTANMVRGPVPVILAAQAPDGYWEHWTNWGSPKRPFSYSSPTMDRGSRKEPMVDWQHPFAREKEQLGRADIGFLPSCGGRVRFPQM